MSKNYDSVTQLVELCHGTAREKGFYDKPRSVSDHVALIHSEVSEALEAYREGNHGVPLSQLAYDKEKPVGFASEVADILIRVFDLCGHMHIPIAEVLQKKMEFNETRPYRHGGKKV